MGNGLFQESDLLVLIDLDLVLGAIGGVRKQTSHVKQALDLGELAYLRD